MRRLFTTSIALAAALMAALACENAREDTDAGPAYAGDVEGILGARCSRCHAGPAPVGGFRVGSYRDAIGCATGGRPLVVPSEASLLEEVLGRPSHREVISEDERARVVAWVRAGATGARAGTHPARFADPRAPQGHVQLLRDARHRPMFDPSDADHCARCHEGAGPRPQGIVLPAPGATSCTSCHDAQGGVEACGTCHGARDRAYPPRDPCFFPPPPAGDVHAAHAAPSRSRAQGIDCAACHPRPASGAFAGAHGDGHVEVWFDVYTLGGASFDPSTRRCAGTCHDRGGAKPQPEWRAGGSALACGDCHGAPPRDHYVGPCTSCHREADATGTSLPKLGPLHANGKVDLGDGSGACGACHGSGESPWPASGAHAAHRAPSGAAPVACETCHVVPSGGEKHPTRAGAAAVRLAGLATKGGRAPTYDAATKTCGSTYCHDGAGATRPSPRWSDGPLGSCGACHASPPPAPHPQSTACGTSGCHVGGPNAKQHVNGVIDRGL
ncbi:MAG: CxxxxCH/CxxCH domain-containing protein [Deltaproteobacteria bacterium]|nr:CxxxxCH/CxxCH domain-containing protein [Deltaproteobacteria bacterium]